VSKPTLRAPTRTIATFEDTPEFRAKVVAALERTKGDQSKAAALMGCARRTFQRWLDQLGLTRMSAILRAGGKVPGPKIGVPDADVPGRRAS
jgi:hypothetical protein